MAKDFTSSDLALNLTPLVGVLLVLLVVFMVVAPPATNSTPLDLPPMDCFGACPDADQPVIVTVTTAGKLFVANRPSTPQSLIGDVCGSLSEADCRKLPIIVRGQADTAYGDFMGVMTGLKAQGFTRVSLLNEDF